MISDLFAGEKVTVETVAAISYDAGLPIVTYADPVVVSGVIVSRETNDAAEPARPFGVSETLSLAFPRTCRLELRGARITVGGTAYHVLGVPTHETSPLTRFDLTVNAERVAG